MQFARVLRVAGRAETEHRQFGRFEDDRRSVYGAVSVGFDIVGQFAEQGRDVGEIADREVGYEGSVGFMRSALSSTPEAETACGSDATATR